MELKRAVPPESALEERLRRMEAAYSRMEESNRQLQSQYDTLQHKYDDLSCRVGSANEVHASSTRGASTRDRAAAGGGSPTAARPSGSMELPDIAAAVDPELALAPEASEAQTPPSPGQRGRAKPLRDSRWPFQP
jgi:hypothetical protein